MDNFLKRRELVSIGENDRRETGAVERAGANSARKDLTDPLNQSAAGRLECAHHGIGVEHRNTGALEHLRDCRLAHADGAGEGDPDHASSKLRSRSAPSSGISGIPRIVK
jgi:hypothetical protein